MRAFLIFMLAAVFGGVCAYFSIRGRRSIQADAQRVTGKAKSAFASAKSYGTKLVCRNPVPAQTQATAA